MIKIGKPGNELRIKYHEEGILFFEGTYDGFMACYWGSNPSISLINFIKDLKIPIEDLKNLASKLEKGDD